MIVDSWNKYLDYFEDSQKDIYYYEEYVKLYETHDSQAKCVICKENNNILIMPFIRKEIDGYYDFETAYGYGGPIANSNNQEWINSALKSMKIYFCKNNYVCGFIRFHSLLDNADYCCDEIQTIFDRETVAIRTDETEEEIWSSQIISKNRNMIRKAEKNELVYTAEYNFESLPEFVKLYNATMARLEAEDFYFFDDNYYKEFIEKFKGKAFLGTVKKDGELICGALFMYSNDYGHYHLEGSNHEYSKLAANNLLLWKTALEFSKLGIKEFHLGGGYNCSPDNSLLKFKKSFSNNMHKFYIGKWIFNEEKYAQLKNDWIKSNPEKVDQFGRLLLCYRY